MVYLNKLFVSLLLAVFAASNAYSSCLVNESPTVLSTAEVSEIYPTAEYLPENLLRFYIYFTEPMNREGILSSISLLDDQGEVIPDVFLDNRYDLWSPDSTRLTVLFDPGRVKTGLEAHNLLGRALISGETYSLQVKGALDAKGCEIASYQKAFQAIDGYLTYPDIDQWVVEQPAPQSRDPLRIHLGREIDHLSLAYRVRVQDEQGNSIRGGLRLDENESVWVFTPSSPWQKQNYQIAIDAELEDVAGNRISGLFDRPPSEDELEAPAEKQYLFFELN